MPPPVILGDWDISDHYPIVRLLPALLQQGAPAAAPALSTRCQAQVQSPTEAQYRVIESNRWEALAANAEAAGAELAGDEQLASIK
jgi:hypothetical protein